MNTESKVTPPTSIPLGPLRVNWALRGALVSTTLLVQMTGDRMRESCVWWIIHTFTPTHRVPHSSYINPFLQLLWASVFILLTCIWRGWQRWVRNLPNAQTQRIGSPLVWPFSERRPAYLHLVLSLGPFEGSDPCLVSGSEALLPGLQGNVTTYTRPCQTCDWHVAAHFQQHSHPPRQITPKPQTDDRIPAPLFVLLSPSICCSGTSSDLHSESRPPSLAQFKSEDWVVWRQHQSKYASCSLVAFTLSVFLCLIFVGAAGQSDHAPFSINHNTSHAFAVPMEENGTTK